MQIAELEHVIRAAASITGCADIVVIGSQSILASFPNAPATLLISFEADVYPLHSPELADLIDGSIGELSPFHKTFGYHAHGVGPETAILPSRWRERVVRHQSINTGGAVGWCLSPVDLAVSKLAAGREKDLAYVEEMFHAGLANPTQTASAILELEPEIQGLVNARFQRVLGPQQ